VKVAIWILMLQALLGAFDTLYYHEYKLRLAHDYATATELSLHATRDFAYAIIIGTLGFATWLGLWTYILMGILLAEIVITLWDFIEEDKVRRLPAGERAMHSIMGIVYGSFLAYLIPELLNWRLRSTGFGRAYHGFPAWVLTLVATGVFVSGIRDLLASFRLRNRGFSKP
jgi:hypothetical protein